MYKIFKTPDNQMPFLMELLKMIYNFEKYLESVKTSKKTDWRYLFFKSKTKLFILMCSPPSKIF